jgi:hypothetical protein
MMVSVGWIESSKVNGPDWSGSIKVSLPLLTFSPPSRRLHQSASIRKINLDLRGFERGCGPVVGIQDLGLP